MQNPNYQHLNHEILEEVEPGQFVPAIQSPAKYYVKARFLGLLRVEVHECGCGLRFSSKAAYALHYRAMQLIELNKQMAQRDNVQAGKATFWRRVAFIYKYGTEDEIKSMEDIDTPELKNAKEILDLNISLIYIWEVVHERVLREGKATVHDMITTTTITDETPEEAAKSL